MRHLGWASAAFLAATITFSSQAFANIVITVDKSTQRMSVAVDGAPRWNWRVSTGAPGYDTPSGTWRAFRMEASHFSKEFDDAPMPNSIFFTKKGHAVHGYLNTSHLGLPVSHGCVRLDPQNAKALYALVKEQGVLNTTVVITGHVSDAAVARRRTPEYQRADAEVAPRAYPESPSYRETYSGDNYYGRNDNYGRNSGYSYNHDDRYYSGPPTPPPGYPAFPRSGGFFSDDR